jgi:signal transduction histidine kinase
MSLRTKLMLATFGGAILPLAAVGLWLSQSAEASGERLLASRLDTSLQRLGQQLSPRWGVLRSEILGLAESEAVQQAVRTTTLPDSGDSLIVRRGGDPLALGAQHWIIRRPRSGVWDVQRSDAPLAPAIVVRVPVRDRATGTVLGMLAVSLPSAELIPVSAGGMADAGSLLAAFDPETRASLLPLPFDAERMKGGRFDWEGEHWLARFKAFEQPGIVLALAAPLTPYTQTFADATRKGALALLIVAAIGSLAVVLFTRWLTRSLSELATAAEAVAGGDLDRSVDQRGADEVSAVARAFNTMTQNLRKTLDKLARQEGLASVGEFAASLAHEVRNPLSAIRVELQSLEEETVNPALRQGLARSLRHVQRLDATVAGSLKVARGGSVVLSPIDLRDPLRNAWQTARAEFDGRGSKLHPLDPDMPAIPVRGDAVALEQLFLNLLLNAAQALDAGAEARGQIHLENGIVEVTLMDQGRGMGEAELATVFEPFHSTRATGTGLGLTIARRIAQAHGGDVLVESSAGAGTTVRVRLPWAGEVRS